MIGKEETEGIEDESGIGGEELGREAAGIDGEESGEGTTGIGNDEARAEGSREAVRSKGKEDAQEEETSVGSAIEGDEEGNQ